MHQEVKRGLKLAGEYLRLPPADGSTKPAGYPSKFVGAESLRRKRTTKEEKEIHAKYYRNKDHRPTHCPNCGNSLLKAHAPGCNWTDDTNHFKTYKPGNPRDDSRRQAPRTSKPSPLVEKFLEILDVLKDDPNTCLLHHVFLLKFKEGLENVDAAKEMEIGVTWYNSMVKELYTAVYAHLQARNPKKSA